ncbi:MAG: heparinase II/III family protein, partial [Proteobacteria bacterium]|nr:heparinase II/III family protein [Pseudomonadota bacterium]
ATRLMYWAAAGALFELRDGDPEASWLAREITRHALFLRDNLAFDLLANHLFRDTAALAFAHEIAGCVPDAFALFEREVREQILPDGAHVERCPMYHAVCLADLVDLRALCGDASPGWLRDAVARASGFLESILLGDGDIPMLGDGWRGEVDVQRLLGQARALETPLAPQAPEHASGLVRLARGPLRCVVRAGSHGPDYQLGHAHADLLSFDVSVGALRVVTDTGTGAYANGPMRRHLRSTAAHNTVQVDGAELLEAWSSFRSGRRGRARVLARGCCDRFEWLVASHDGYRWLPGSPEPQRLWLVGENELWVLDAVLGTGRHRIESRLHLHPDAAAAAVSVRALGAVASEGRAPLHEHFNATREMSQLVVATEAPLPWLGGFWLRIGATPEAQPSLALDGRVAKLRLAAGTRWLAVDWNLDAPGAAANDDPRQRLRGDPAGFVERGGMRRSAGPGRQAPRARPRPDDPAAQPRGTAARTGAGGGACRDARRRSRRRQGRHRRQHLSRARRAPGQHRRSRNAQSSGRRRFAALRDDDDGRSAGAARRRSAGCGARARGGSAADRRGDRAKLSRSQPSSSPQSRIFCSSVL